MEKNENLLTRREAAELLGLKPQTLAVWAVSGKYLPYVRCGRAARYKRSDIEQFIRLRTVGGEVNGG